LQAADLNVRAAQKLLCQARSVVRQFTGDSAQWYCNCTVQGVLHILFRGTYTALAAAGAFDVFGLVNAVTDTVRRLSSSLLPRPLGGQRSSVKGLFRSNGFFGYADEREAQVSHTQLGPLPWCSHHRAGQPTILSITHYCHLIEHHPQRLWLVLLPMFTSWQLVW
jgi:hypothetical protein